MTDTQDGREDDVGSLAEEATKLLGALNDWARDQGGGMGGGLGGGLGGGVAGVSGHASAAAHDVNAHFATGAAECTVCPICRTVHAARQLSPEVTHHLASAAASLMHAAAGVLATVAPTEEHEPDGGLEHIDLDEDSDEWPQEDPS